MTLKNTVTKKFCLKSHSLYHKSLILYLDTLMKLFKIGGYIHEDFNLAYGNLKENLIV